MLHLVTSNAGHRLPARASRVAPPAEDEPVRLAVLERYDILDTPPEPAFDRITALAADLFTAPIAIIGFVGLDRVSFKSHHGLPEGYIHRGPGVSARALDPWIRLRFKHGFHLGVPLRSQGGHELGILSVIDRRPRRIDQQQIRHLGSLRAIVMDQLQLRLSAREAAERAETKLSEIDDRAMNSLQFIASLLRLQSRGTNSARTSRALMAAARRVVAVARVHGAFSVDENVDHVPIVGYLRELCDDLSGVLAADIGVEGLEENVSKEQVLTIGLIVNQLVTDARTHGARRITVAFRAGPNGQHELQVLDEGHGPSDVLAADRRGADGVGLRVVNALVTQLDGRISVHPSGQSSCVSVTFPAS